MSSVEYELGKHPGAPELERVDVDPITMRVLGGAFHAIAKEMSGVLFRMSYSSIIRESEDLGAGIFDSEGNVLAESDSTPMFMGAMPKIVKGVISLLGEDIHDGDVILHNDPYLGATHSPDVAIVVPIFFEGELAGFDFRALYAGLAPRIPGVEAVLWFGDPGPDGFDALLAADGPAPAGDELRRWLRSQVPEYSAR